MVLCRRRSGLGVILPNGSGFSKRFWTATTSFKGMEGCTVITGRSLHLFIAVIGTFEVSIHVIPLPGDAVVCARAWSGGWAGPHVTGPQQWQGS